MISNRHFACSVMVIGFFLSFVASLRAEISLQSSEKGVAVFCDGSLFCEYITCSGGQPAVWPIIGPGGVPYTRSYPIGPREENENNDHPHHRSLWFAHGDVNGEDFWHEPSANTTHIIKHRDFEKIACEKGTGTIVTRNDWIAHGKKVLEDKRTLQFGADKNTRWIDFTINLKATEGDVRFGDTKEGTFAVRVAGSMKVDAPGRGKIVNSLGATNDKAWGQRAPWVDYHGPVQGKTVGIAILDHPSNHRYPCRWHVRNYGLFAANPFGESDFPKADKNLSVTTLSAGKQLRLRYRVILHAGDSTKINLDEIHKQFARF